MGRRKKINPKIKVLGLIRVNTQEEADKIMAVYSVSGMNKTDFIAHVLLRYADGYQQALRNMVR